MAATWLVVAAVAPVAVLTAEVQDAMLVQIRLLGTIGPTLGRPTVGTLKVSKVANLKELQIAAGGGVWRVALAFDS